MNDPDMRRPSPTEEIPATPGWVESELDGILGAMADHPAVAALRGAYLDCLAAARGPVDAEERHDGCRAMFLRGLHAEGLDAEAAALEPRLAALEAEVSART